ncbi:glycosyltransferase family 4 protein [Thermodesulfatator indicus]|uniref:glycosyltransferase family 4 protein n=1 Tax=Thermodesulfatator indicus TaxID=171695 RepID=UPI0002E1476C|nr:glycosyltransferase family 4 protein [Thermodesulfatator indicus]
MDGDRNNSSICHYEEAQSADEVIFPKEHPLEIIRFPFCVSSWGIDRNFFKNTYLLWQFFKKIEKPITIHVVKAIPEAANLLWLKFLWKDKLKIVTYAHGEEFLVAKTSKELGWLTRQALRISDLVIANSFSTKRLASEFCDENKIHVVHLGVDFEQYQIPEEECQKYRQKWGFPENTVILLTVARMEPRKNQAAVIKTVAELRKEGLPLAYVIAGSGEEERKLKNMVQEYNLEPWVKFLGKISEEEKIKSFCAADIYVMPSIQVGPMIEGFGIVFMEAAAAGLPSIAGNIGGQPEAVRHEETGFVIDGNNLNELKEAIRRLAQDKNLRQKMGEAARLWARKHDWSLVSRRVYEVVSHV